MLVAIIIGGAMVGAFVLGWKHEVRAEQRRG